MREGEIPCATLLTAVPQLSHPAAAVDSDVEIPRPQLLLSKDCMAEAGSICRTENEEGSPQMCLQQDQDSDLEDRAMQGRSVPRLLLLTREKALKRQSPLDETNGSGHGEEFLTGALRWTIPAGNLRHGKLVAWGTILAVVVSALWVGSFAFVTSC